MTNVPTYKNQLLQKHLNYIQSSLEISKAFVINLEVCVLMYFCMYLFGHNYVSCYSGEMSTKYSGHKWPQSYLPDAYKES